MIEELYTYIADIVNKNIFAQGGVIIAGITTLATTLWYSVKGIFYFLRTRITRYFKTELYIDDTNEMYEAFDEWFKTIATYRSTEAKIVNNKLVIHQFQDFTWFWRNRRLITVRKSREALENASNKDDRFLNKYHLYGYFCRKTIEKLREDIFNQWLHKIKEEEPLYIYHSPRYHGFCKKPLGIRKEFKHLYFNKKEELIQELDNFIALESKMKELRIPYNIGILLHGPPGTGKTSIVYAVAQYLQRDLYNIKVTKNLTDEQFQLNISEVKSGSIVLFEDYDRFNFDSLNESTILSCIDGIDAPENTVFIMTTNNVDKIKGAIVRAGRFSLHLEIGYPTKEDAEAFVSSILDEDYEINNYESTNMAEIQHAALKLLKQKSQWIF